MEMPQSMTSVPEETEFRIWQKEQKEDINKIKKELEVTKRQIIKTQKDLDLQRERFERECQTERQKMEREKQLFEMKWKVLEDEYQKLAKEKEQLHREKEFFGRVNQFEKESQKTLASAEIFFIGVGSEQSLKKRYKDLLKIYHPDNISGDTKMIQQINREYDSLRKKMKVACQ